MATGSSGGDAEGVAELAELAAEPRPWHRDALFAGEIDEDPRRDEEVTAEAQLFDEREFLFDLLAGRGRDKGEKEADSGGGLLRE